MGFVPSGRPGDPLEPRLRVLDTANGELTDLRVERARSHSAGGREHAEFTVGHRCGDTFIQCTRTDVLILDWPTLRLRRRVSHPLMHDVHDALLLPDGTLAVASTGIDSVLHLRASGELIAQTWLDGGSARAFAARFGPPRDFRRLPAQTFKPHRHHPNHLLWLHGTLWVTCLATARFHRVDGIGASVAFPEGPPHDGHVDGDLIWFTTVTGHVLAFRTDTLKRVWSLDLTQGVAAPRTLGWCRGLCKVGSTLFVGMTQLRESRWRDALRTRLGAPSPPSRILAIDIATREIVREYPVGNAAGGTIYAVTPLHDGAL